MSEKKKLLWNSDAGDVITGQSGIHKHPETRPVLSDAGLQEFVTEEVFTTQSEIASISASKPQALVSPTEMILLGLLYGSRDVALVCKAAKSQRTVFEWFKQEETNVELTPTDIYKGDTAGPAGFAWLTLETDDSSSDDGDLPVSDRYNRNGSISMKLLAGYLPSGPDIGLALEPKGANEATRMADGVEKIVEHVLAPVFHGRHKDLLVLLTQFLKPEIDALEISKHVPKFGLATEKELASFTSRPRTKRLLRALGLMYEQHDEPCLVDPSNPNVKVLVEAAPNLSPGEEVNQMLFQKVSAELKGSAWWLHNGPRLLSHTAGHQWLSMSLHRWQNGFSWAKYLEALVEYCKDANVNAVSYMLEVGPKFDPVLAAGAKKVKEEHQQLILRSADQTRIFSNGYGKKSHQPKKHNLEAINLFAVKFFDAAPDYEVRMIGGYQVLQYPILSFYVSGAMIEAVKWLMERWELKKDSEDILAALIDSLRLQVSKTGVEYLQSIGTPFDKPCALRDGLSAFDVAAQDETASSVLLSLMTPGFPEFLDKQEGRDTSDDDNGGGGGYYGGGSSDDEE